MAEVSPYCPYRTEATEGAELSEACNFITDGRCRLALDALAAQLPHQDAPVDLSQMNAKIRSDLQKLGTQQ